MRSRQPQPGRQHAACRRRRRRAPPATAPAGPCIPAPVNCKERSGPAPPRSGWGTGHRAGRTARSCPASRTCQGGSSGGCTRELSRGSEEAGRDVGRLMAHAAAVWGTMLARLHAGGGGQHARRPPLHHWSTRSLVGLGGHQGQVLSRDDLVSVNVLQAMRREPPVMGQAPRAAAGGRRRGGGGARAPVNRRSNPGAAGGRLAAPSSQKGTSCPSSGPGGAAHSRPW